MIFDKYKILHNIIALLDNDLLTVETAATSAHEAAINSETQPDNKYDTLSLESSYIAQGYANRAQQLRRTIDAYKKLHLTMFTNEQPIALSALVGIEYSDGSERMLFIGPAAGGLKMSYNDVEIVIITPESPLCRALMGHGVGDLVTINNDSSKELEILVVI